MRQKIKYAALGLTMASLIYTTFLIQTLRSIRHEYRNNNNQ